MQDLKQHKKLINQVHPELSLSMDRHIHTSALRARVHQKSFSYFNKSKKPPMISKDYCKKTDF